MAVLLVMPRGHQPVVIRAWALDQAVCVLLLLLSDPFRQLVNQPANGADVGLLKALRE
jgi:hypothetical protein